MINAFALFAAGPLMLTDEPPRRLNQWAAARFVDVNIVRGQVHRVTSRGPVKLFIQLRSGRPADVQIEITQVDGGLAVRDVYPAAPLAAVTECVPDAGDRGAFWNSDVILDVTVSAPAPLVVRHHVMDERPIMRFGESAAAPDAASR